MANGCMVSRAFALIVLCLFAVIWGWMAVGGSLQLWSGLEARSWPLVRGEIVSSEAKRGSGKSRNSYEFVVLYRYRVADRQYESNRIRAIGSNGKKEVIEARVRQHPPGSFVSVYYNPVKPSVAYLETGVSFWEGLMPVVGAIVFTLLVFVIARLFKRDEGPKRIRFRRPSVNPLRPL